MSVFVNDIENRELLHQLTTTRLKEYGIKYKVPQIKHNKKQESVTYDKIFFNPLVSLPTTAENIELHNELKGKTKFSQNYFKQFY